MPFLRVAVRLLVSVSFPAAASRLRAIRLLSFCRRVLALAILAYLVRRRVSRVARQPVAQPAHRPLQAVPRQVAQRDLRVAARQLLRGRPRQERGRAVRRLAKT